MFSPGLAPLWLTLLFGPPDADPPSAEGDKAEQPADPDAADPDAADPDAADPDAADPDAADPDNADPEGADAGGDGQAEDPDSADGEGEDDDGEPTDAASDASGSELEVGADAQVEPPQPTLVDPPQPEPMAAAPTAEPAPAVKSSLSLPLENHRLLVTMYDNPAEEVAQIESERLPATFSPNLQLRVLGGYVSPFEIDRFGNSYDEGAFVQGRVRFNPVLAIGKKRNVKFVFNFDAVNGRWTPLTYRSAFIDEIVDPGIGVAYGQPPGRPDLTQAEWREAYIEYTGSKGLLRIGQQSFAWGQGILANNGNNMDRYGDLKFGNDGPGDIFERALFATRPFQNAGKFGRQLGVAIAGDLVAKDERADLRRGDLAGQVLLVVRWQDPEKPHNQLGGYVAYRGQRSADDGDVYRDDNTLQVFAFDLQAQGARPIRPKLWLTGAFEGVFLSGRTDATRNEDGRALIRQGALVGRGYIGNPGRWQAGFDAGFASGDGDPSDRRITNFTFDQGHTVGLVLFQQVNGWRSARSEILATDGSLTGEPLNGTQFVPSRGAVTNAIYAHPKAQISFLRERLEIWGGPLFAASAAPIADPYTTRINGGDPTNSVGGDGNNRYYGTEFDLGIRARYGFRNLWGQVGVQGGLLLPGRGIANESGEGMGPIGAVWIRSEIRY